MFTAHTGFCKHCGESTELPAVCESCEAKLARLQYFKEREARMGRTVRGRGYDLPMPTHIRVMNEALDRKERHLKKTKGRTNANHENP